MTQFQRIRGNVKDPRRSVREGGERGVYLAAEHLLGVSRQQVPRDEGTLQRSGATATDGLHGVVSYDTPYAVRQHEELTWNHPRGGNAKYLEGPMGTESDTMQAVIHQAIKQRLAQG